jgi:hypothetical protein
LTVYQASAMNLLISKTDVLNVADRAANFYIQNKTASVSSSVVDAIGDSPYNPDQVERIVQATNQAVWAKLASAKDPSTVRFEPASTEDVMSMVSARRNGVEKTAGMRPYSSAFHLEKVKASRIETALFGMTKVAHPVPQLAMDEIPNTDLATWDRIIAKVAEARVETERMAHECDVSFVKELGALQKYAQNLYNEGVPVVEILDVVRRAAPGRVGEGLASYIEKQAFVSTEVPEAFARFIQRGQETNLNRTTLWDRPAPITKTAGFSANRPLNDEHPLVKCARNLSDLHDAREDLTSAYAELEQQEKQARQLSLEGAEVPIHV